MIERHTWHKNTDPFAPMPNLYSSWKNALKYPSAIASAGKVLPLLLDRGVEVPPTSTGGGLAGLDEVSFESSNNWK